jgi:hypothetical protein
MKYEKTFFSQSGIVEENAFEELTESLNYNCELCGKIL